MQISIQKSAAWLKNSILLLLILLALISIDAHAQINSLGMMDNVLDKYAAAATTWQAVILKHASWLFWTLATISLVWTFGFMALRKADIGEFFAEFIKFMIFTGFFFWLLSNGPSFATAIIDSLRQIAAEASGTRGKMSPSNIVDIGFEIFNKVLSNSSGWKPLDSAVGIVMAAIILVVLALVAVNMLILLISAWILAYAGAFFLGFGGSRWTSEIAITYFKTVLSVGAQLFTMVLVVGIGKGFIDVYYQSMGQEMNLREMPVMLVISIVLLVLVNKLPPLISSLCGGPTHAISGGFGAGAVLGAAAMGAAAAATAGAAIAAGGASIAGGAQALMSAYSAANAAESGASAVSDLASAMGGGDSEGSGGGGSPLASAMGDSDSGGSSLASAANSSVFGDSSSFGSGNESGSAGASSSTEQQGGGASAGSGSKGGNEGSPGEVKSGGALAAAGAAAARVGRVAAGTATNLAQGTWDVAKAKGGEIKGAAMDRISETTGGKIAAAINARANATPESADQADPVEENSLSKGTAAPVDAEAAEEIAAFVNRDAKSA